MNVKRVDEAARVVHRDERPRPARRRRPCRAPACRAPTAAEERGNSPSARPPSAAGRRPAPSRSARRNTRSPRRARRAGRPASPSSRARAVGERRGRRASASGGTRLITPTVRDDVDDGGEQRADDRRARNRARRVAHAVGRNRRALEPEKRPQRQRRRRPSAALRSARAVGVGQAEVRRLEGRTGRRRPTTTSGRSLSAVVTICTRPAAPTPRDVDAR